MVVRVRRAVVVLVVVLFGLIHASTGQAAGPDALGQLSSYPGPTYAPLEAISPTEFESQSKLWFHDGAWWALMLTPPGGLVVHELEADHTWRPASEPLTAGPIAAGDALAGPDGDVHVVFSVETGLTFAKLSYDATSRGYQLGGGVVPVSDRSGRSASIAADSTGRLWVALVTTSSLFVTSSADGGASWSEPLRPPVEGSDIGASEVASIVAFDESIGVMWSDQVRNRFNFAIHRDDAPVDEWTVETMLSGQGLVDDHISLKVVESPDGDMLVAGVKTAQNDREHSADAPLIVVLTRAPSGVWMAHVAATVADDHSNPLIVVDESNRQVYLLAQAPERGGAVYVKRAPLDALTFEPGRGTPLIEGAERVGEATAGKSPVTSRSGLVILAASADTGRYHHAELAIPAPDGSPPPGPADDADPPPPPSDLVATQNGSDSVALYWSPSVDPEQWRPARDGAPAEDYIVMRDGAQVGSTDGLSFVDRPPDSGATYRYAVAARDGAGNRSTASMSTAVTVVDSWWPPAGEMLLFPVLAGLAVVAAVAVALGIVRARRRSAL